MDDAGRPRRDPRHQRDRRGIGNALAVSRRTAEGAHVGPRIGVLFPVYAGADAGHFREALLSIRAQQGVSTCIFLACDGPLLPAHERVIDELVDASDVVLRSERRSGLARTLNRTIEAALRDPSIAFIARMDADDISVPQRLLRQSQFLEAHPDISVVGSWCVEFSEPGVASFLKRLPTSSLEVRRKMIYRSPLAHPAVMFRRQVFEAGHRYDPSQGHVEDYALWSRLLLAGIEISNLPEYLLWYRVSPELFSRRSGWRLGVTEVSLRVRYAWAAGLLRPWHFFGLAGLFLVRVAPVPVKKLAYRMRG